MTQKFMHAARWDPCPNYIKCGVLMAQAHSPDHLRCSGHYKTVQSGLQASMLVGEGKKGRALWWALS